MLIINYSADASIAWEQVKPLPEKYHESFLKRLDEDPEIDATALAVELRQTHLSEIKPFDSETANDALEQARTISLEAEAEFITVYNLLGSKILPSEILDKLEKKYGPSEKSRQSLEAEQLKIRLQEELREQEARALGMRNLLKQQRDSRLRDSW